MGYVERCLWDYRANMDSIRLMREELSLLMSVHGAEIKPRTRGGISDPVSDVCAQALRLERNIRKAERKTKPITSMLESLRGSDMRECQMRRILELRYFEHGDKDSVIRTLSVSIKTYYRRCGEIKRLAGKYFGEWG